MKRNHESAIMKSMHLSNKSLSNKGPFWESVIKQFQKETRFSLKFLCSFFLEV